MLKTCKCFSALFAELNKQVFHDLCQRSTLWKRLIMYSKFNGIAPMKNHIESTHPRLVASGKLQTFQVYNGHKVHNMLTIMFDPHFKSLTIVENYVGHGACIPITSGYDANVIIPFFMTWFEILNPIAWACSVGVVGLVARFSDFINIYIYIYIYIYIWCGYIYGRILACTSCWRVIFV